MGAGVRAGGLAGIGYSRKRQGYRQVSEICQVGFFLGEKA